MHFTHYCILANILKHMGTFAGSNSLVFIFARLIIFLDRFEHFSRAFQLKKKNANSHFYLQTQVYAWNLSEKAKELKREKRKSDRLLFQMLPLTVVTQLKQTQKVIT